MNLIIRISIILAKCCIILAASTNRLRFRDERIIGGHEAKPNSHPYIVSLQLRFFWVRAHICGGSILTENWILTAGHCITESWIIRWLPMDAIAGAHNVDKFGPKAQIIGIDQRIPHPLYMGGIGAHDIAMLKTKLPITFTKAVQPVNLPQPSFRYENLDSLKLSGWGALRTTLVFPDMPSNLQEVDLTFVPFEKCYEAFDKLAEDEEIPLDKDSNMCTGPITGGVAACSGDSGGPLVYYFKTKYVNARGKVLRHDVSQPKIRHIRQSDDSTTTEDPDEMSTTQDDTTTTEDQEETTTMEDETMSTTEESQSTTEDPSTTEGDTTTEDPEETSTMEECRSAKCMNTEDTDETTTTEESEQTTTEEETTTTEEPEETSTMEECRSGKCMNTEDADETTTTEESEDTTMEQETTTAEEPEETSTMEECRSAKCMNTEDTDETTTEGDTTTTENADETTTEQETTTTEEPEETSTMEECRSGKCMNTEDLEETTTEDVEETTTEEETIATEEELSETESTTTEDPEETTAEEVTTTEEPEEATSTTEVPTTTDIDSSDEYYSYEYQDLLDYIYYIFFGDDEESDENSEDDDDDDDEDTLRRQPRLVESVERNEAIPMILGVVSWGVAPCGEKGAPTVYTKVSSHIDFINEHIYS